MNLKNIFSLMVLTLVLTGCTAKAPQEANTPPASPSSPAVEMTETETNTMKGTIEKIDAQWNKYSNEELGFSFEYPQVNFVKNKELAVEIIEDGNNVVYLSDGQYPEEIEKKKAEVDIKKASGIPFAFLIKTVENDTALDQFIKDRYGKTCKLGKKEASGQEGVLNVGIDGLTSGDEPDKCFVNYITMIKYSPEKGKVATWDVGQDVNFYQKDTTPLDEKISKSFKFL